MIGNGKRLNKGIVKERATLIDLPLGENPLQRRNKDGVYELTVGGASDGRGKRKKKTSQLHR